jgi:hypothetical protein
MKAAPNIPAALIQAGELHFSDGEFVGLAFSLLTLKTLKYSRMKIPDKISSSRNIKKTKRTFEGFRISVSSNRRKGNLAISVYFIKVIKHA